MVSVFEYENPNEYIGDMINAAKRRNSIVSYRYISSKTNLDASNIAKVVQGKRSLSSTMGEELAKFFKLKKRERLYLENLIKLSKTADEKKKQCIFDELMRLRNVNPQKIEMKQYDLYQKWHHIAILALLHYFDFNGNFKELAASLDPAITEKDAMESITLLEKLGLIKRDNKNKYVHAHSLISTGEEWKSIAIKTFQRDMLQMALRSIDNHSQKFRDVSTLTITGSYSDILKIKEEAAKFRKKVLRIAEDSEECQSVYQLNIQLFPLTSVAT